MPNVDTTGLAAPATRRAAVAVAVLAAALRPGQAAHARKSCRKKARKSVDKTHTRMRDQCLTYYAGRCNDSSNPEACLADMTVCCGHLAAGNFTEHVTCLYAPR